MTNQRLHPRVALKMMVQFRSPDAVAFVDRHAANISMGGMYVVTDKPLPLGTELTVRFTVADHPVVECTATVVRHGEDGMGLRFSELPSHMLLTVEHLVAQHGGGR